MIPLPAPQGRIFVILNPVSGSCDADTVRDTLEQQCTAAAGECDIDIYETTGQEQLSTIVHQARERGYKMMIAAGGDGTVSAVAGGLILRGIPLGILPVGTANLVARELGIPLELAAACRLLFRENRIRVIDVMQVGDQAFISHISLGVYSRIAEKTSATAKRYFRQIAYIWNALPELIGRHSWRFNLIVDGQQYSIRAAFIMIANVGAVGASSLRWGPDIKPDDGQIDICIVRARTLRHYLSFIWHTLWGQHRRSPHTTYLRAKKHIKVSSHRRVPVRGDGEIVGESHADIQIIPKAIQIIVPDQSVS